MPNLLQSALNAWESVEGWTGFIAVIVGEEKVSGRKRGGKGVRNEWHFLSL
jgi:hypothetical protein